MLLYRTAPRAGSTAQKSGRQQVLRSPRAFAPKRAVRGSLGVAGSCRAILFLLLHRTLTGWFRHPCWRGERAAIAIIVQECARRGWRGGGGWFIETADAAVSEFELHCAAGWCDQGGNRGGPGRGLGRRRGRGRMRDRGDGWERGGIQCVHVYIFEQNDAAC